MASISTALTAENRDTTASALQQSLSELIDLALLGKQAHWNIYGKNFRALHLQLDEVVDFTRQSVDTVAERIIAIGAHADGRAATVAQNSDLPKLESGPLLDSDVVTFMVEAYTTCIANMRERIEILDSTDLVSQDILIGITAELEKQSWMFQAETS
ncbi:Dps family protein [Haloglycomyces albus]|uniref:Dps family protein n=1 Tax=Haloglycomyces albus TaxID=526067 RepID=UPI00046CEC47|nr:DNA starvation/stationary phase protection protein [Haloglycomyces albus]